MRVRVDHAADAVYLNLTDRPIKDSAEVADGIIVDYDDEGALSAWKSSMRQNGLMIPRSLSNSVSNCRRLDAWPTDCVSDDAARHGRA